MSHSTNHLHKLPKFRHLLKSSWQFYKHNWKKLVAIFAPIEIALFGLTLIVIFGLTPARFYWTVWLIALISFVAMIIQIFKKMMIFGGGMIASSIEEKEEKTIWMRYKDVLTQAMPIIWVGALQMLFMCSILCATILLAGLLFFLPFIILGLLSRIFPDVTYFIASNGGMISVCMFFLALVGLIATNIFFAVKIWFAPYTLLLEGRDGIDALADSAMLVRGKSKRIFWRMVAIGIIVIIPAVIILGPIYAKILIEAAKQMAIAFALGLKPVFPPIATDLIAWRSVFALVASLVSVPMFVVLNYFLWRDVKASAVAFEEAAYTKTRKWIKISVWVGLVLAVLFCSVSMLAM